MSNEYKDWLQDSVVDLAFERGLVDKITKFEPDEGFPHFIWGLKNGNPVKYEVIEDEVEFYKFEHRELDN